MGYGPEVYRCERESGEMERESLLSCCREEAHASLTELS